MGFFFIIPPSYLFLSLHLSWNIQLYCKYRTKQDFSVSIIVLFIWTHVFIISIYNKDLAGVIRSVLLHKTLINVLMLSVQWTHPFPAKKKNPACVLDASPQHGMLTRHLNQQHKLDQEQISINQPSGVFHRNEWIKSNQIRLKYSLI